MKCNALKILITLVLIVILVGCVQITHRPLNSTTDDSDIGIRYYRSSPYLIVYSNGKGGIVTKIEYLPDPQKMMSVVPTSFMASLKTTMEFKKGVLTSSDEEVDGTVVPTAILKAVDAIKPDLELFNKVRDNEFEVPAPSIYKIIVNGSNIFFRGGHGDGTFKVTLVPKKEETK